jgi:hypothetical protein
MTKALPKQGFPLANAAPCETVRCTSVHQRGLETVRATVDPTKELRPSAALGAAESGAVLPESLAAVLLNLSPADRARLAAMLLGQQMGQAEGKGGTP